MLLGGCRGCRIRRLSGSDLVVVGYCYYHRKAWWIFESREGEASAFNRQTVSGFRFLGSLLCVSVVCLEITYCWGWG